MKLKLPNTLYAPEQMMAVHYELQAYGEWMANNQVRKQTGAKLIEEPTLSDETIAILKLWQNGDNVTAKSISELIAYLSELNLPVIHVMLAASPSASLKKELVKWFRELGGVDYLISISVDRTLGGGAIIRTPNKYYNFSFNHLIIKNRDKLPNIIRQTSSVQASKTILNEQPIEVSHV